MESREVGVKDWRVVFEQLIEVGLGEDILFFIQVQTYKQVSGITLGHTCNIRFQLGSSLGLLQLHLRRTPDFVLLMVAWGFDCEVDGVPLLFEDVRDAYFFAFALLYHFLDAGLHFDVLVGGGRVDGINWIFAITFSVALLWGFLDDGLVLDFALGPKVVGEHVVPEVLEKIVLEEHLVELCQRVAEQLSSN